MGFMNSRPGKWDGRRVEQSGAMHKTNRKSLARQIGPGIITGAADDDPSGIATYSQAGAQVGFGLLWTMLLTYPLMTAIQLISADIGRVTGHGLAHNIRRVLPRWAALLLVGLLFFANTINIGADLAAMGAAGHLVTGWNDHSFTVAFAFASLLLQLFVGYRRYAAFLKWLTLGLLAYVGVLFVVHVEWGGVLKGLFVPDIQGRDSLKLIVAVLGTTISPYLFFWQSSQEVEEVLADQKAKPLNRAPEQAGEAQRQIALDTFAGMAISNLVALAIMICTAATLHAQGKREIATAADAAKALQPIAGDFAFALFSLGIIGTGLLAIPVLAGSVGYAVSGLYGWKAKLDHRPSEAPAFYAVIGAATLLGLAIDWLPIDPIQALVWSAIINGVVAAPIMIVMMLVATNPRVMKQFVIGPRLRLFGWIATATMGAAAIGMFATL